MILSRIVSGGESSDSSPEINTYFAQDASADWDSFLAERERVSAGIFGRCRVAESGCWEWTGCKNHYGYGVAWYGGAVRFVHRVIYEMFNGLLRKGLKVCHSCDNPGCINPMHLVCGTQANNIMDMTRKRRHPMHRVTDETAMKAREMRAAGQSYKAIGEALDMSHTNACDICKGKTFKHLPLLSCPKSVERERTLALATKMLPLREQGLTTRQIADTVGVSYACAYQALRVVDQEAKRARP